MMGTRKERVAVVCPECGKIIAFIAPTVASAARRFTGFSVLSAMPDGQRAVSSAVTMAAKLCCVDCQNFNDATVPDSRDPVQIVAPLDGSGRGSSV